MAATGKHLKLKDMGDNVIGVVLEGDPKKPEPIHFRVVFPGGDIDIARTSNNQDYWVHVRVDHPDDGNDPYREVMDARIVDARLDCRDKDATCMDVGDFNNPTLYHLAVRITREAENDTTD
jgi:hypothetical protein